MSISAATVSQEYSGNGAASAFNVPFRFVRDADVKVTKTDAGGVKTVLSLGADYALTGADSYTTGVVTLTAGALPTGFKLLVERTHDLLQPTTFPTQGQFLPEIHEDALDRIITGLQFLNAKIPSSGFVSQATMEAYVNAVVSAGPSVVPQEWHVAGDGVTKTFNISGATGTNPRMYIVTVNGLLQIPSIDYTIDASLQRITFATAPPIQLVSPVTNVSVRMIGYATAYAAADDAQILATGTTTPQSLADRASQYIAGRINVRDYGLTGSAFQPANAIIQTILDAALDGSEIFLPQGDYLFTGQLSVTNRNYIRIQGEPGTRIIWKLNDNTKDVIKFTNCSYCEVRNLRITAYSASYRADAALRFDTHGGRHIIEAVQVDGLSPTTWTDFTTGRAFDYAVRMAGTDGNNDHHTYLHCQFQNIMKACVSIETSQSVAHRFICCLMRVGEYAIKLGTGAGFKVFGMSCSEFTKAIFFGTSPQSHEIVIVGVNAETVRRFLITKEPPLAGNSDSAAADGCPVTVIGCRIDTDEMAIDGIETIDGATATWGTSFTSNQITGAGGSGTVGFGAVIEMRHAGPLVLIGNQFGVGNPSLGGRRAKVQIGSTGPAAFLVSIGNKFVCDNPVVSPASISGGTILEFGNNCYVSYATPGIFDYYADGHPTQKLPSRLTLDRLDAVTIVPSVGVQVAPAGALSIESSLGEVIYLTINGNISANWDIIYLGGDIPDKLQREIHFIQGAGGPYTIGNPSSQVFPSGGQAGMSFTNVVGRRDIYVFRYKQSTNKWYEVSRSVNVYST